MKRKKNPTSLLLFLLSFLGGILLSSSLPVQSTLLTPSPSPSSSSSPAFSDAAVIPEEVFFQNPTLDEDLAKAYSEAGDLELDLDTIRLLQQDKEWSERTGLDEASTIVESPEELRIARAGYDDATALNMVLASAAAYCAGGEVQKWTCKPCARLSMSDVEYIEASKYKIAGYVGVTHLNILGPQLLGALYPNVTTSTGKAIVIAFRGTKNFKNWIQNLKTSKVTPTVGGDCRGCLVHKGFQQSFVSVREKVTTAVQRLAQKHNAGTIIVTGHSLGGALANLAAWDISVRQKALQQEPEIRDDVQTFAQAQVLLYTYGQPRVGNEDFSKALRNAITATWRVVHRKDVVAHLPPKMFNFHHLSREVWFPKGGMKCDWNTMCALCSVGGEDKRCSNSIVPTTNIPDHLKYLDHAISGMC